MALSGLRLVSIVVLCIPIISGYLLPQVAVDESTSEYENSINDFVETIIEEETCGGVISAVAEPRSPGFPAQGLTMKDCFECNGLCYPVDYLMNDIRRDVECFRLNRRVRRRFGQMCHQIADILNKKGRCGGGFYRCYRDDVHASLELPTWKPVCVCEGLNGVNCISGFVEKRKCSIEVQGANEKECECLVNVNLQPYYRK